MSVQATRKMEVDALTERLLALSDAASRKRWVSDHDGANWVEVVTILTERVWQEVRVDTVRAEHTADIAIEVAEVIGDKVALAKSLRAKANALYALDRHAAAIQLHGQAVALFEAANDPVELARTLSGSIQPLLLLGRYDDALSAGERACSIFRQQGNKRRLARVEINIGNVYHRQDRFTEAVEFYERAYQELMQHDDPEGIAAALSNLSLCCISLNDFPKALDLHR